LVYFGEMSTSLFKRQTDTTPLPEKRPERISYEARMDWTASIYSPPPR
jgi:hypothetical protein